MFVGRPLDMSKEKIGRRTRSTVENRNLGNVNVYYETSVAVVAVADRTLEWMHRGGFDGVAKMDAVTAGVAVAARNSA
ncbi:hypothetical protein NEUTE1DRAFT_100525 [Neurospora tetrasperma FGSC 2508]|uniref:Uncharacterized protein n=1 Tax=Neurospora tetrasperma (strain FGSC 2508 / ATCC MYA-4615 / P0657) TaxID=510951 RepID=F8MLQ4_NEUT8|nr:uncharacterized protein NEUTE1DRAFT_100525 [Neurospora tetrasperma FGSC 2508]EGO57623.1 hypothetical protein NEUTE1DRAFT_100525 [Neurospora tetrasperma FGSC 2508]EGZ72108.1 hypothetical protein NEUTE2DRAFT_65916 [Neurospora tetrasperma FGSC 2509]